MNSADVHPNSPSGAAILRRFARAARSVDVEALTVDNLKTIVSAVEMIAGPFAQRSDSESPDDGDSTSRLKATFDDLARRADQAAQELEHHEQN